MIFFLIRLKRFDMTSMTPPGARMTIAARSAPKINLQYSMIELTTSRRVMKMTYPSIGPKKLENPPTRVMKTMSPE